MWKVSDTTSLNVRHSRGSVVLKKPVRIWRGRRNALNRRALSSTSTTEVIADRASGKALAEDKDE